MCACVWVGTSAPRAAASLGTEDRPCECLQRQRTLSLTQDAPRVVVGWRNRAHEAVQRERGPHHRVPYSLSLSLSVVVGAPCALLQRRAWGRQVGPWRTAWSDKGCRRDHRYGRPARALAAC
jgi:hypothetical protein